MWLIIAALGAAAIAAYEYMKPATPVAPANTPVSPATPVGPAAPAAGTVPPVAPVQPGVPAPPVPGAPIPGVVSVGKLSVIGAVPGGGVRSVALTAGDLVTVLGIPSSSASPAGFSITAPAGTILASSPNDFQILAAATAANPVRIAFATDDSVTLIATAAAPAPAPSPSPGPSLIPGLPDAVRPMLPGDLVVLQQPPGPATLVHVDDVTSDPTGVLFTGTAVAPPAAAAMGSLPMLRQFARPASAADIAALSNLI